MSKPDFHRLALDLIEIIDYDMWKEAKFNEPEEWEDTIEIMVDHLYDLYEEGQRNSGS